MSTHPYLLIESQMLDSVSDWRGVLGTVACWVFFGPVILWSIFHRIRFDPAPEITLALWALVSGVGSICTLAGIRATYFAVTSSQLQIGRSPRETIVEFSEIESIVVGLPAQQSLFPRIGRYLPHSAPGHRRMARRRRNAIFIRLRGERYVALSIPRIIVANVESLNSTLLWLNRSKVVGADSYTPKEIKRLRNVCYYNRVRTMM